MRHRRHLLISALLFVLASAKAQEVTFSAQGGFYDQPFELTLSCWSYDKVIHFTTNGNTPTASDPVYTHPLSLDKSLESRSNIYTIPTSPEDLWYQPKTVQRCIVIRAAAFDTDGQRVSPVVTNSYFIKALGCNTHGLPIMSLCADSLDLFDYNRGILVPGVYYDPENHDYSGNYYQSGDAWERPCNVEFYENDNLGINQQAGVRTQGLSTRRYTQKGLKIYARNEYGKKRFKYKFFNDTDVESFKHLKIKPFKGGWLGIGCQDYLSGRIARSLDIDCLASRPMVLFLNGEYWGIYFLQEKPDERFIEDHYDADLNTINIIESWIGNHCEYGSGEAMINLYRWIDEHDLSDDNNYQYVAEQIDISNFIDYEIFEIFSANLDWPANNVRSWQTGNSLWRWIFYDGDACLFRLTDEFDAFANATYDGDGYYPSSAQSTLVFRKLMENNAFKAQFLSRFYSLMGSNLNYSVTQNYYNEIYDLLIDEIPNQVERFDNPTSVGEWKRVMKKVDRFLSKRLVDMEKYLLERYGLEKTNIESLYPNPAHDLIKVEVNSEEVALVEFEIINIMGQKVYHSRQVVGRGTTNIPLHIDLKNGVYFLKVGNSVKKFIVIN